MKMPRAFRAQATIYEAHGFHVTEVKQGKGSHLHVRFAEFPQMVVMTVNLGCPRALMNNVARLKRFAQQGKEAA